MSSGSSSAGGWSTRLEPAPEAADVYQRPDDPRLGNIIQRWQDNPAALRPGRPVLIGFPQDEGVRRNHGRTGAAAAPNQIRRWLRRLTPWDPLSEEDLSRCPPLDLGNLRIDGTLEQTQQALGEVIGAVLASGAVPVILGGGHETAYGHYLGYVAARRPVGIINIDAHLDVRPTFDGRGHSGSPFRQALEDPDGPLPGAAYTCLAAQPGAVSRAHWHYIHERGGVVRWCDEVRGDLVGHFGRERDRLSAGDRAIYVTIDADVVHVRDVPGVSAPNPAGLAGEEVLACARRAGRSPEVASLDLVEINPSYDRDGQSARWAALVVWHFLIGLSQRPRS